MKGRLAAFLVPPLTALIFLYQVFSDLQIAVTHDATLRVIGLTLGVAVAGGVLAAVGPSLVRVGVLTACAILFLDLTVHLSGVFDRLTPRNRVIVARDEQRIADLHRIKIALDAHIAQYGSLPTPNDYGEATGASGFWQNYWDVSSTDGDADGRPFLDFLVDGNILSTVPVDPVNVHGANADVRDGQQYVFFLVPPDHLYEGGACDGRPDRWVYMVGVTDLEYEPFRPPARFTGSGCTCLWRDRPNYFQQYFDYILCGEFQVPASLKRRDPTETP
jgi:hypothetical protein